MMFAIITPEEAYFAGDSALGGSAIAQGVIVSTHAEEESERRASPRS